LNKNKRQTQNPRSQIRAKTTNEEQKREIEKHTSWGYGSNSSKGKDCMRRKRGKWRIGREGIRAWMQGDERYEERERKRERGQTNE